jgi:outer membrane protein assembly factor BamB
VLSIAVCVSAAPRSPKKLLHEPAPLLPAEPAWTFMLDMPPSADGAMDEERVYVPLKDGTVRAYDRETGMPVWMAPVETTWPPAVGDGGVYLAAREAIRAFDASTGDERWASALDQPLTAPPVWDTGWLIVSTAADEVLAMRTSDGEVVWRRSVGATPRHAAARADTALLVLVLEGGRVLALNLRSGEPLWEDALSGTLSAPALAKDRVFIGSTNNFLYAFKAEDGRIAWKWRTGGDVVGAAADADTVYVASLDNVLRAVNRGNGNQRWKTQIPTRPSVPPIAFGNIVVLAGVAPQLDVFVGKTGTAQGNYRAASDLQGAPLIDRTLEPYHVAIVVIARDGTMTALRPVQMMMRDPPLTPLVMPLPGHLLPRERLVPADRR